MNKEQRNEWIVNNMGFIYTVCKKYKNLPNQEDIIQTACYGALEALSRAKEGADEKAIRSYVARYIDGYVLKLIKKNSVVSVPLREVKDARVIVESLDYEKDGITLDFLQPYNETGYEEAEILADLDTAIKKMPEKKRKTAFLLMAGYERSDIAKIMGCTTELIRLRIKDIRKEIKKALTKT